MTLDPRGHARAHPRARPIGGRVTAPPRLVSLVRRLTALPTRSRQARKLEHQLEHLVLKTITTGGLRAVERAIATLNAHGRRLALVAKHPVGGLWREEFDGGRSLEISAVTGKIIQTTHVQYRSAPKAPLPTPRGRKHALQEAFYARYMAVGQKAYPNPRYRLTPSDRLLLLIGELEADVNNGGFDQYLGNKGRRRALAALAALRTVGARKTADMLKKAMAPGTSAEQRSALDDRFYRGPEDLAVLAARHVKLRPNP
jgi:hypothetical protein